MGFSKESKFKMNEEEINKIKRIINDELTEEEELEMDKEYDEFLKECKINEKSREDAIDEARKNKSYLDLNYRKGLQING